MIMSTILYLLSQTINIDAEITFSLVLKEENVKIAQVISNGEK